MRTWNRTLARLILVGAVVGSAPGCSPDNPNEREMMRDAPAGKKSEDPEDIQVSHRRDRTQNKTHKQEGSARSGKAR